MHGVGTLLPMGAALCMFGVATHRGIHTLKVLLRTGGARIDYGTTTKTEIR